MVSSVRCFLVQLFLNSIDRISDALGHAEHVMQLYHLQTVHSLSPHPITIFSIPQLQRRSLCWHAYLNSLYKSSDRLVVRHKRGLSATR